MCPRSPACQLVVDLLDPVATELLGRVMAGLLGGGVHGNEEPKTEAPSNAPKGVGLQVLGPEVCQLALVQFFVPFC
jgi:hypothetical protein